MRRLAFLAGPACLVGLLIACYGSVLFRDHLFAYRDAAHFYYPLYLRVQQEWAAGRIPLWEPEENAGMPLLGNPTAAVLYPGKLFYAIAPSYAWGVRLYTIAHTLLAVVGTFVLMRSWEVSRTGSGIAALSYGFGAPILFQYCNIIFLVGAAWLPLGLRAADRWLRLGRRWALGELALVLALQTLGGDPQAAYVTGVCAGGYAIGLSRSRRPGSRRWPAWAVALGMVLAVVAWTAVVLYAAYLFPTLRPERPNNQPPPLSLPWMPYVNGAIRLAWVVGLGWLVLPWLRRSGRRPLPTRLLGLLAAAGLSAAVMAAQLVPVLEFTSQSVRAAREGPHDIYPFSLEPVRVAELAFPNVFGSSFHGNRLWLTYIPPAHSPDIWVPSLYLGVTVLVLALAAAGFRNGPPWRAWLTAIALASLLAALGKFGSPIWLARNVPGMVETIGRQDLPTDTAIRIDKHLRDGDGGFYWLLATVLPGFKEFRYPSKLLTFTSLALAALAGLGWDRVVAGRSRRRWNRGGLARRRANRTRRRLVGPRVDPDLLPGQPVGTALQCARPVRAARRLAGSRRGAGAGDGRAPAHDPRSANGPVAAVAGGHAGGCTDERRSGPGECESSADGPQFDVRHTARAPEDHRTGRAREADDRRDVPHSPHARLGSLRLAGDTRPASLSRLRPLGAPDAPAQVCHPVRRLLHPHRGHGRALRLRLLLLDLRGPARPRDRPAVSG